MSGPKTAVRTASVVPAVLRAISRLSGNVVSARTPESPRRASMARSTSTASTSSLDWVTAGVAAARPTALR